MVERWPALSRKESATLLVRFPLDEQDKTDGLSL